MGAAESPVESLLAEALLKVLPAVEGLGFRLVQQFEVPPYRLDFAFFAEDGRRLCVEVDGYENHDRTKLQAQHDRRRDRALLLLGWRVVRFTGSEVYNTAATCANEVLLHLKQLTAPSSAQTKLAESIAKAIIRLTRETNVSAAKEWGREIGYVFTEAGWVEVSPGRFAKSDEAAILSRRQLIIWCNMNPEKAGVRTTIRNGEFVLHTTDAGLFLFYANKKFVVLQENDEYLDILDQLDAEKTK